MNLGTKVSLMMPTGEAMAITVSEEFGDGRVLIALDRPGNVANPVFCVSVEDLTLI